MLSSFMTHKSSSKVNSTSHPQKLMNPNNVETCIRHLAVLFFHVLMQVWQVLSLILSCSSLAAGFPSLRCSSASTYLLLQPWGSIAVLPVLLFLASFAVAATPHNPTLLDHPLGGWPGLQDVRHTGPSHLLFAPTTNVPKGFIKACLEKTPPAGDLHSPFQNTLSSMPSWEIHNQPLGHSQ